MKNEIITTPNEVASYLTWVINDIMIKLQSKDFKVQDLTLKGSDEFKRLTIKEIKAGILKEAPANYQEQRELLYVIEEARKEKTNES